MFSDTGETPTRYELLSMVKKHSNLLGKTIVEESDAPDVEMDMKFWHDVFDLYFVRGKESRGRQDDDLVFFVRKLIGRYFYSFKKISSRDLKDMLFHNNGESDSPFFVRRWAPKLDDLIDETSTDVDWRRSFYLNLIAHTSFSVTIAICSHQVLQNHQASQSTPLSPIYKVVKTVYASPSRVNFQLNFEKEVETTPAYPDICFAIDDFDSTFDAVCPDGACRLALVLEISRFIFTLLSIVPQLTLFSGFVSYQMVRDSYDAGKSRFGSLLSGGHSPGKTDRIYMKGPGGRGEVEVAVSGVTDQSQEDSGPFSPVASKKGFGIGTIVRRAASVASVAAKHAYAAASSL